MKKMLLLILIFTSTLQVQAQERCDHQKGFWDGLGRFVRDVGVGAIGGAIGNIVSDRIREERPSPSPRPERPAEPPARDHGGDPAPAPAPAPGQN